MASGLNILLTGQAGTGKTTMLQAAAKELGWNMKYFSTSTLDPFADLIGIPVPNQGRKTVEYFRPRELDDADVVFFDELNRADLMVLNAVFEIVQFRSLNGEKLEKLKCVVAAVNPVAEGYATRDLDIALRDRFDLYLESDPNPSWTYFRKRYGEHYARAGFELFQEYNDRRSKGEDLEYFSPRRLDKMLSIFQQFPVVDTVKGVVPAKGTINFNLWAKHLGDSIGVVSTPVADDIDERIRLVRKALRTNYGHNMHAKKEILNVYNMAKIAEHPHLPVLKRELAHSLNEVVTGREDLTFWLGLIKDLSDPDFAVLVKDWPQAKALTAIQVSGRRV